MSADESSNGGATNGTLYEEMAARMREEDQEQGGFFFPGSDAYADDWQMDLKLPECPDIDDSHPSQTGAAYELDAMLVVGRHDKRTGRLRNSAKAPLRRVHISTMQEMEQLRESTGWNRRMREWNWSPDPFSYGSQSVPGAGNGPLGTYLPIWPGPVTRQLYWQDYFAMSAKSFEAYNHDPISWRCVHMKQEFALGKGLQTRCTYSSGQKQGQTHTAAQTVWEEFWKRNKMDNRLDMAARDLSVMGEQFMRFFTKGKLTTIRSLDPASIYDLITDPEDHETVFAYHQQFQTPYQLYPPKSGTPTTGVQSPMGATQPGTATKFIVRQILPQEIDHYRINTGAYERRGRSDLFPALGWIRRLRDYLTSHVVRADMLSRICWDLEVAGNVGAIQNLRSLLFPNGHAPPPGSIFGHNSASKLNVLAPPPSGAGSRFDPVLDSLVTLIADSIGLPKDWLGFGQMTTRAGALVATEPAARSLEELQGMIEGMLHDTFDRVMAQAKINDAEVEFTFPSIATEDRTAKLQDLSFAEANNYISKQTAASIAAKELGITGYDYNDEQGLIADEFPEAEMEDVPDSEVDPLTNKKPQRPVQGDGKMRRPMIVATNRQAPKLDPTKSPTQEDEPAGLLVPTDDSTALPGQTPVAANGNGGPPAKPAAQPTRNGMPSDENALSGKGAANIKSDLKASAGPITFSEEQVAWLLMRERRRSVADPDFQKQVQNYREGSAENLGTLAREALAQR